MTLPWLLVYIFTWVPPQYPSFLVIYASASGCQMKISDWNGSERSVSTQVWHRHRSLRPAGGDEYTRLRPETVNIKAAHNGQMSAGLNEFFFCFFCPAWKAYWCAAVTAHSSQPYNTEHAHSQRHALVIKLATKTCISCENCTFTWRKKRLPRGESFSFSGHFEFLLTNFKTKFWLEVRS